MWPNSSIANRMVVCKTHCANALPRKSPHHRLRLNHFPKNLSYGFRPWYHLWQQSFEKRSKSMFRGHYNRFWQSSMHVCDQRPPVRLDIASRSLILTIKSFPFFARMSADPWFLHIGSWGDSRAQNWTLSEHCFFCGLEIVDLLISFSSRWLWTLFIENLSPRIQKWIKLNHWSEIRLRIRIKIANDISWYP